MLAATRPQHPGQCWRRSAERPVEVRAADWVCLAWDCLSPEDEQPPRQRSRTALGGAACGFSGPAVVTTGRWAAGVRPGTLRPRLSRGCAFGSGPNRRGASCRFALQCVCCSRLSQRHAPSARTAGSQRLMAAVADRVPRRSHDQAQSQDPSPKPQAPSPKPQSPIPKPIRKPPYTITP